MKMSADWAAARLHDLRSLLYRLLAVGILHGSFAPSVPPPCRCCALYMYSS